MGISTDPGVATVVAGTCGDATSPPSPVRQVATGGLWTALTWVLTLATGPVVTVILVRSMTSVQFGEFALASSSIGFLAILSAFGLDPTVARFAARALAAPSEKDAATAYRAGMALARRATAAVGAFVLVIAALAGVVPALRPLLPALLLATPVALLAPFKGVYGGVLRAVHRPVVLSVATVVSSLIFAAVILGVIEVRQVTAPIAAAALSLEALACTAIRWRGVPRSIGEVRRPSPSPSLQLNGFKRFALAVLLTGVLVTAISDLDVLFLGLVRGTSSVAAYAPVSMIANGMLGIPAVVGAFFLPAAARLLAGENQADLARLYHWASRWSLVLCAPALAVLIACPGATLTVLFGVGHSREVLPLRILGLGATAQVLFGFNGLTLDAYGLAGVVAKRQAASLVVSLVLCATLIPAFGPAGAAAATAGALLAANCLCSVSLLTRYRVWPWDRAMALVASVATVATAAAWLAGSHISGSWPRVVMSAGLVGCGAALASLCVSDRQERSSIWYGLTSPVRSLATVGVRRG